MSGKKQFFFVPEQKHLREVTRGRCEDNLVSAFDTPVLVPPANKADVGKMVSQLPKDRKLESGLILAYWLTQNLCKTLYFRETP